MNKQSFKMTKEELEMWLALRKKCYTHKTKKAYSRKEKHKKALTA